MTSDFRIEASRDISRLAAELKANDEAAMAKALRLRLKAAAEPAAAEVRTRIGEIPAGGPKHTGLRARMQRATVVQVRFGSSSRVAIKVSESRMPAEQRNVARAMDTAKGWRHPVYGHDVYVQQPGHPYFEKTLEGRRPEMEVEASKVLDDVIRRVT